MKQNDNCVESIDEFLVDEMKKHSSTRPGENELKKEKEVIEEIQRSMY